MLIGNYTVLATQSQQPIQGNSAAILNREYGQDQYAYGYLTVSGNATQDYTLNLTNLPGPLDDTIKPTFTDEVRKRTITFNWQAENCGDKSKTCLPRPQFQIDQKVYEENRTDHVVGAHTKERWYIVNLSPVIHPFHIHVNPFRVHMVQINNDTGLPESVNLALQEQIGQYRDVVMLPPKGYVVIEQDFVAATNGSKSAVFVGKSVFHCHFLTHEDQGMMNNFVIADNRDEYLQKYMIDKDGYPYTTKRTEVSTTAGDMDTTVEETTTLPEKEVDDEDHESHRKRINTTIGFSVAGFVLLIFILCVVVFVALRGRSVSSNNNDTEAQESATIERAASPSPDAPAIQEGTAVRTTIVQTESEL
eukprot:m.37437 g.37437  ORF g.37437 m.37437 type:complete len:362 (-) comp9314_c0_seq2:108-1193(-)